ncbi:STAS/SEC14 domain-containing protein [Sediminibacterium soli]|uniref:STAS/SEC14 domain-containing protein n=1 Tax=Sediminibacterium soli TaxID=2698829 RepID=UPI001379F1FA|nr:STAS/SEC14 domain-containing protein [Sediminibacterium soli]NCI46685.1 STAS/SEC14 domain-containing protein [Sediminibacterium soli]
MLQLLDFTSKNIIATKADGQLRRMDYEKIYPLVHNILLTGKKVRWYLEVENFDQWSHSNFIDGIVHAEDFEKISCVGVSKGDKQINEILKPYKNAEIEFFSVADREKAISWIKV